MVEHPASSAGSTAAYELSLVRRRSRCTVRVGKIRNLRQQIELVSVEFGGDAEQ